MIDYLNIADVDIINVINKYDIQKRDKGYSMNAKAR